MAAPVYNYAGNVRSLAVELNSRKEGFKGLPKCKSESLRYIYIILKCNIFSLYLMGFCLYVYKISWRHEILVETNVFLIFV